MCLRLQISINDSTPGDVRASSGRLRAQTGAITPSLTAVTRPQGRRLPAQAVSGRHSRPSSVRRAPSAASTVALQCRPGSVWRLFWAFKIVTMVVWYIEALQVTDASWIMTGRHINYLKIDGTNVIVTPTSAASAAPGGGEHVL